LLGLIECAEIDRLYCGVQLLLALGLAVRVGGDE
jgi:hypothetical protein